jgi:ring-1,2-phenylacetyl-CoA epoxidase subunit PaaD
LGCCKDAADVCYKTAHLELFELLSSMPSVPTTADLTRARAIAADVLDPEIPVLTIADLGILRDVRAEGSGIVVALSPTYLGCPAVLAIELATEAALRNAGFADVRIERVLSPAWSTDDITEQGRKKLHAYGIAPPGKRSRKGALMFETDVVACPRCGSTATERLSEFGSTACKAQWRCTACREPFDYFKCI